MREIIDKLKRFYILTLFIFINCATLFTRGINHQIYKDKIKFRMVYEDYDEKVKNLSSALKTVTYEEHKSFMRYRFHLNDDNQFCYTSNKGKRFINLWELNLENCNSPYEDLKGEVELIPVLIIQEDKDLRYQLIKNTNDIKGTETQIIDRYTDSLLIYHFKDMKEKNEILKNIETLKTTEKMREIPLKIVLIIFDKENDRQFFYAHSGDVLPSMNTTTDTILRSTKDMEQRIAYRPDYIRGSANLQKISIFNRLFYASRILIAGLLYPIAILIDTIVTPPIVVSCLPYVLSPNRPNRCYADHFIPKGETYMDPEMEKKTHNNPIYSDKKIIKISN
jgi:hypothetical protein